MAVECQVRPITESEIEQAQALLAHAFDWPRSGADLAAAAQRFAGTHSCAHTSAAFVGGRMVAYMQWEPVVMSAAGKYVRLAAAGPGATLPEARGRGYNQAAAIGSVPQMRAEGCLWSGIITPVVAFHRANGWDVGAVRRSYRLMPETARLRWRGEASGTYTLCGAWTEPKGTERDLLALASLYDRFAERRCGPLERTAASWRALLSGATLPGGSSRDVVLWRDASGQAGGYVVYERTSQPVPEGRPPIRMDVRELVAATAEAYCSLLDYLLGHTLTDQIYWSAPADDPLALCLVDPTTLQIHERQDFLLRILDVPAFLAGRPRGPFARNGRFTMEVVDRHCPWNHGTWSVEVEDEAVRVQPSREQPALTVQIDVLGPLCSGNLRLGQCELAGRLEVRDRRGAALADAFFCQPRPPFCADEF
jgi:predicted acetyltransferase